MNDIINYDYVSSILNTRSLSRGANSDLFELLSCAVSDQTQVCHITKIDSEHPEGAVVIDDQTDWSAMVDWLTNALGARSQNLFESETLITALLSMAADTEKQHNLRAGEAVKVLLSYVLHANSDYGSDGYPAGDVWTDTVEAVGQVRPALDAQGQPTLKYRQGYSIQVPDHPAYGRYTVSTDGQPGTIWGHDVIGFRVSGPRGAAGGADCYYDITMRYKNHDGSLITETAHGDLGRISKFVTTGGHSIHWYYRAYTIDSTAQAGDYQLPQGVLKVRYGHEDIDHENSNPSYTTELQVQLRTDVPLVDYTVQFGGTKAGMASSATIHKLANGERLPAAIRYIPSVHYDGHTPISLPYDKYGISFDFSGGEYQDYALVSVVGQATSSAPVSFRAIARRVTTTDGSLTVPSQMALDYQPAAIVWFDHAGELKADFSAGSGTQVVQTRSLAVDAASTMRAAMANYDRPSIWESFDQITANQLQPILGDRRLINDYYLSTQYDYTVMCMLSDTIDDLRRYMSSDDGVIQNNWNISFFADVTLTPGQRFPATDWMRVRMADGSTYVDVGDLNELTGSSLAFDQDQGEIVALDNVAIHLERFTYKGLSLDEWYYRRESANEFSDDLASAKIESNTQMMLRTVAQGTDQATDWVSNVGQMLRDIVSSAREEAMDILQLTPYNVITVPQRKALSGAVGSVAIPATYVADMVETAASLGATSASQIMNVLDMIPSADGKSRVTSVQDRDAAALMQRIIDISAYAGYSPTCLIDREPVSTDVPYWSTFTQRMGSSIISAGGVDCELADLGSGANAIFPPLLTATVNLNGDYGMGGKCSILPFEASLAVIYPTSSVSNQYTVAWLARYYGGNDHDALSCIQSSYNELARVLNVIGAEFAFEYEAPDVISEGFVDKATYASLAGTFATAAMGALAGAVMGIPAGPVGIIGGAGIGACVALEASQLAASVGSVGAEQNLQYTLSRLSGAAGKLTFPQESRQTSDPNEISRLMASVVMALMQHGAYHPLGLDSGDLVNSNRYALLVPTKPYYRYAYIGEHEDYTPLLISAAAMITAISAKVNLKALKHPTYDPAFAPVAVMGSAATLAQSTTSAAMQKAAAKRSATFAMQQEILDSVKANQAAVGQSGVYEDTQGVVTLRDLQTGLDDMKSRVNSIESAVSNQGTCLTY